MEKGTRRTRMWCGRYCINGLTLCVFLCVVLVCFAPPGVLHAVEEKLPDAELILDRYVEVTGGIEAYEKIHNRVTNATHETVQAGFKVTTTICHAKPNKMFTQAKVGTLGKMESGTNGDVAWELSMFTGPKIKEGQERADALREAIFNKFVYWRKVYQKVECIGVELIEGRACYKVVLTPKTGKPHTFYFDQESNLLVKVESIVEHQMGTIPIEGFLSDYKEVDGILIPHKAKVKVLEQDTIITTESVEHNVEIPEDLFKLPEEIQALVNKAKSE